MKTILLILLLALVNGCLYSQSASPEVIGSAGTHSTTATAQVSWTVGEVATTTLSAGGSTATQGFHQTFLTVTSMNDPMADFQMQVYPNPASTILNVEFEAPLAATLELFDMHGHLVAEGKNDNTQARVLDVTGISSGPYVLRVTGDMPEKVQQFRIQVIHTH